MQNLILKWIQFTLIIFFLRIDTSPLILLETDDREPSHQGVHLSVYFMEIVLAIHTSRSLLKIFGKGLLCHPKCAPAFLQVTLAYNPYQHFCPRKVFLIFAFYPYLYLSHFLNLLSYSIANTYNNADDCSFQGSNV